MANHAHPGIMVPAMPTKHDSCCKCPACSGLECLCRPRFFAGQLLTEEDLNRLDHYIFEKNKLHNRYLHGWGVVCGFEVVCHPCENLVTVRAGYALSPCGEDIIACEDHTVDICELIKRCRDKQPRECEPPFHGAADPCQDLEEEWLLMVCYDEKPSRGITALKGSTEAPCCSRCSCGGSKSCGCGCHEKMNGKSNNSCHHPAPKPKPPQCEPTVICEGFRYDVFKAPETEGVQEPAPIVKNFVECYTKIAKAIPQPLPSQNATPSQIFKWCCALKSNLQDHLISHPTYNCELAQTLAAFQCPTNAQNPSQVFAQLVPILAELIQYCFCSALLPPCPEPACEPCVILATVTVRKRDCRIIRICNWEGRKFATTFPNLQYWFGWLPYAKQLRDLIIRLCCEPIVKRELNVGATTIPGAGAFNKVEAKFMATELQTDLLAMAMSSWAQKAQIIDSQILAMGTMGLTDKNRKPFMTETELKHPLEFLFLNQVATPLMDSSISPEVSRDWKSRIAEEVGASKETKKMKEEIHQLREKLEKQQQKINDLNKRLKKK